MSWDVMFTITSFICCFQFCHLLLVFPFFLHMMVRLIYLSLFILVFFAFLLSVFATAEVQYI